jgi:hypothetical protein
MCRCPSGGRGPTYPFLDFERSDDERLHRLRI